MLAAKKQPAAIQRIDDHPQVAAQLQRFEEIEAKRQAAGKRVEQISAALAAKANALSADAATIRAKAILAGESLPTALVDDRELLLAREEYNALVQAVAMIQAEVATARQAVAPGIWKKHAPAYKALASEVADRLEELAEAIDKEQAFRAEVERAGFTGGFECSPEINGLAHMLGLSHQSSNSPRHDNTPGLVRRSVNKL